MATRLAVTFIDVGSGDSILIEAEDADDNRAFALVDCNDTVHEKSSELFLKRFFERKSIPYRRPAPRVLRFVLLTHTDADHASGVPRIIRTFGCDFFLYSESSNAAEAELAQIIRYHKRPAPRLGAIETVRQGSALSHIPFCGVDLSVLWPERNFHGSENDHSVVLSLALGKVTFVLTGDVSADRARQFVSLIPSTTELFQVPHHGAADGTFDRRKGTPWVNYFSQRYEPQFLAISCHTSPYGHPEPRVINLLNSSLGGSEIRRTDLHYHLTFETDGSVVRSYYTHP